MQVRDKGRVYEGPEPTGQTGRGMLRRWGPILGRAGIPGMVQGGRTVDACYLLIGLDRFAELASEVLEGWTRDGEAVDVEGLDLLDAAEVVLAVLGKSGFFGQAFRAALVEVERSQGASSSASPSPAT